MPAMRTSLWAEEAAATPTIRLAVETMPSLAPSTAARSQPMRWTKGPTVVIGGEDLWPFHPADGRLPRTDPLEAAHATDPDTRRWVEMLIEEGHHRGVHLVIDSTLGRPEVFARTAGALRPAGYRVEAHALAVSPEWSWQGVHQRCERVIAQGGAPRVSTRDAHDAAVAAQPSASRAGTPPRARAGSDILDHCCDRVEQAHGSARAHYVHRPPGLGSPVLINENSVEEPSSPPLIHVSVLNPRRRRLPGLLGDRRGRFWLLPANVT